MDKIKAQAIASALIGLGFGIRVTNEAENYIVIVEAQSGVNVVDVSNFAVAQQVTGMVVEVRLQ